MQFRLFFIVLGLVLIALASCSPQKQLAKLLEKYAELLQTETITVIDTVIVPEQHYDTTFVWNSIIDTVTVEKKNLWLKIIRHTDTITVEGGARTDTIIQYKNVEVERIKYVKEKQKLNYNFLLIFGALLLILFIILAIKRRSSRKDIKDSNVEAG